jgi:HPr kinase/phosphorylase
VTAQLIHASCVTRFERGILLRGDSGAGKSSLALQLINLGWMLVADDYVALTLEQARLTARAPDGLRGWLEIYGLGICPFPAKLQTPIDLIVDLVDASVERLPAVRQENLLNCAIKCLSVPKRDEKNASLVVEALRHSPHLE